MSQLLSIEKRNAVLNRMAELLEQESQYQKCKSTRSNQLFWWGFSYGKRLW